jgi:NADH pyrophosphatase NudC (nudix superfamily)
LNTLKNKHTSPNFETIRRLIKQKTQEKFSQEAIASSNKTQWQNIKTKWENNRKEAVQTSSSTQATTVSQYNSIASKTFNHNYCTICKHNNTVMDKDHLLVCPKLNHTCKELPKLYWDARKLIE